MMSSSSGSGIWRKRENRRKAKVADNCKAGTYVDKARKDLVRNAAVVDCNRSGVGRISVACEAQVNDAVFRHCVGLLPVKQTTEDETAKAFPQRMRISWSSTRKSFKNTLKSIRG